ncbi:MAG: hypothetical protein ACKO4Q_04365, partial [Planctomycetota bacterium]
MLARDRDLLGFRVAAELDQLEPVDQRLGDRREVVGGDDEQALLEVESHAEVVVGELAVLRGIEDLEQRA